MENNWITTYSGKKLNIFKDYPSFDIKDIAHGLSLTCRFSGQCSEFYSVGLHSIFMKDIVLLETADKELALQALMHDASEFVLGDLAHPIKSAMPEYSDFEDILLEKIFYRFNIQYPLDKRIKKFDRMLCRAEAEYLNVDTTDWRGEGYMEKYPIIMFNIRNPKDVEELFLKHYYELT